MSERKQSVWAVILQKLELRVLACGAHDLHSEEIVQNMDVIMTLLDVLRECELVGHGRDYVFTNLRTLAGNAEVIARDANWKVGENDVTPAKLITELLAKLEK